MPRLPGAIPLFTRLGNEIPNEQHLDLEPMIAEQRSAALRRKYPTVDLRRPPSGQYNCHGLTLANRRTWIYDPKVVLRVLLDDGYRQVMLRQVEPGDIVVYYEGGEISHTGVVLEVLQGAPETPSLRSLRIISKWGPLGEYIHLFREGPYHTHRVEYWTDRP